jgi:CheY-like chemotaxis protein
MSNRYEPAAARHRSIATSSGGRPGGLTMARILVIDDQPSVSAAIQALLEHHGHTAVVAECGHNAVSAIEAFSFDVAMVDIIMPGLDGLDTIKMLRGNTPNVPIIAMSGYAFHGGSSDLDFFGMASKLGATCCLQKPFKPRELIEAIETCLASPSGGAAKVA